MQNIMKLKYVKIRILCTHISMFLNYIYYHTLMKILYKCIIFNIKNLSHKEIY